MDKGYYRVHLVASDGDWITLHVPLNEQGGYNSQGRSPHPLKAKWRGCDDYGELVVSSGNKLSRIVWGHEAPDYLTDLLTTPIKLGIIVKVYEGDDEKAFACYDFIVKYIDRI